MRWDVEKENLNKKLRMATWKGDLALKEMNKLKVQHGEQMMKFDVVEAEKKCLEAASNNWEAKYNKINLKLKLKNHQFNSLNAVGQENKAGEGKKCSIGTQTIKEEPKHIGAANILSSSLASKMIANVQDKSTVRNSMTPTNSVSQNSSFSIETSVGLKRKRSELENQEQNSKHINTQKIFNCSDCIWDWAHEYAQKRFVGLDGPDPIKWGVCTLSSASELKSHMIEMHRWLPDEFCKKKNCLQSTDYVSINPCFPHGDLVCGDCEKTFANDYDLDSHGRMIHGNITQISHHELFKLKKEYFMEC